MAINVLVTESELFEPIPESLYKAVVKEVTEETGEFGEYIKFIFEITEGEHKGVTRSTIASKKLSKTKAGKASKLYEIVKVLTKEEPKTNETLDLESLVGKTCQIFIKNGQERDGVVYQNVGTVMPF